MSSKSPRARAGRIAAAGVVVVALAAAAFFLAGRLPATSASGGGPEMALKVIDPATSEECEGTCQFELGAPFTLAVEIVQAPSAGYVLAQSFINFGDDLTYNPVPFADRADEIFWPDCEGLTAVRAQIDRTTPSPFVVDYTVNHGCLTGLIETPPSTYVGDFLRISMTCSNADTITGVVQLPSTFQRTPPTIQFSSGSAFEIPVVRFGGIPGTDVMVPKLTDITIICGQPPAPTPGPSPTPGGPTTTPTAIPTATPAVTATPTTTTTPDVAATPTPDLATATPRPRPCGDIDGNGLVNSQDALWVLWLTTGMIDFVPFSDDLNGDGRTGPIDALLILQIEANLFICR